MTKSHKWPSRKFNRDPTGEGVSKVALIAIARLADSRRSRQCSVCSPLPRPPKASRGKMLHQLWDDLAGADSRGTCERIVDDLVEVDAQSVVHRGMDVDRGDRLACPVRAEFIRRANHLAGAQAPASDQPGRARSPVGAARVGIDARP